MPTRGTGTFVGRMPTTEQCRERVCKRTCRHSQHRSLAATVAIYTATDIEYIGQAINGLEPWNAIATIINNGRINISAWILAWGCVVWWRNCATPGAGGMCARSAVPHNRLPTTINHPGSGIPICAALPRSSAPQWWRRGFSFPGATIQVCQTSVCGLPRGLPAVSMRRCRRRQYAPSRRPRQPRWR